MRISNVSEHGALVIGRGLPAGETAVTFHCNGLAIESFVAWSSPERGGIQFESPIEPSSLTQKAAPTMAPIVKPDPNADFRRPGFRGNQLSEEERRIVADWQRPLPKRPQPKQS